MHCWLEPVEIRKPAALQLQVLKLLQLVAHQVQPILRARKWRVPLLSEFSPNNPRLLVKADPTKSLYASSAAI